ncbi:hypothetical protein [uncultured Albimonas sp.]|uniref:hypothetical protein n=1 Tax=uncultured Albimonas sp. TaxID=1331701 RepID=UPI0030EC6DAF
MTRTDRRNRTRRSASFAMLAMTVGAVSLAPALAPIAASAQTTDDAKPTVSVTDGVTKDQITVDFADEAFMEERRISEIVQEVYGPGAEQSSGSGPSEAVQQALDVGQPLPAGANAKPVEMKLASRLPAGPEWLAVGENLVAVDADGRVSRVYHDMLP